ncbi:MAG: amidohydrolase family protein, partial [Chloroflexi bacterium]|nr:amidohydrolase family protein [Chloroflexota bacterium]
MRVETVIVNGKVVRPQGISEQAIAIEKGKIVAIAADPSDFVAKRTIDATGKYVLPGLIDTHVHIGWPDWPFDEATETTTKAAAAGGVTTLMNYIIEPESLVKGILEKKEIYKKNAYVDAGFHALIFSEKNIEEIPEIAEQGVRSFKFFIPYRGPEAVPPAVGIDDGIIYFGFEKIAKLAPPRWALVHAENIEIFFKYKEKFTREGRTDFTWHDTRPNFSEVESMRRVSYFAKVTGCPVYCVHMSVREGPEEILRARAEGVN